MGVVNSNKKKISAFGNADLTDSSTVGKSGASGLPCGAVNSTGIVRSTKTGAAN
jgi:hypothetical protein